MTGDRVSRYSSGDGLLANQVLASGALLRQYVTSADGKTPWRVNFRFSGDRDAAKAAELGALPKLNSSGEVKFGYDPSSFYSGSTPKEVVVRSCNWIRKQFSFGADLTVDMSLASPALLLESPCRLFHLDDPAVAPPTHFGYRTAREKSSRESSGTASSTTVAVTEILYVYLFFSGAKPTPPPISPVTVAVCRWRSTFSTSPNGSNVPPGG